MNEICEHKNPYPGCKICEKDELKASLVEHGVSIKTLDEGVPNMAKSKEYKCHKIVKESFGDFYFFIGHDGKEHSIIDAFVTVC
jgi:hypothetical protein